MRLKDYSVKDSEVGDFKTRIYSPNLAIDCRVEAPAGSFLMMKNLYFDHKSGMLKSIPGFKKLHSLSERIYSLFSLSYGGEEKIYIHSGGGLYSFNPKGDCAKPKRIGSLHNGQSHFICLGQRAFLIDGEALYQIEGEEIKHLTSDKRIAGSTRLAYIRERLFLSGNPEYVGKIFYSEPICGEVIFPEKNAFPKLPPGAQICDIIARGKELWVFKSYDDGGGSILCYSISDLGEPTEEEIFFSIPTIGKAGAFGDRIIFLSNGGVYSISPSANGKRHTECISRKIAHLISGEDLRNGRIIIFSHYIGVLLDSKIYLGDTLLGGEDFCAWYFIDGIGSYKNDRRVYRYSAEEREGYQNAKTPDGLPEGEIISLCEEGGEVVYFERKDDKRLLVYPTEEFFGGDFSPMTSILNRDEKIFFGTGFGDLCIFNSDETTAESHSFASHAVEYFASLRPDDCSLPALAKSSVPSSLIISLGQNARGKINISVKADEDMVFLGEVSTGSIDFSNLDFSTLSTTRSGKTMLIIPERAQSWREKQISVFSNSFGTMLEIEKISFGYRIKGRLKSTT